MVSRASNRQQFFPGNTEMAGRMRALDWSRTALGRPRLWPEPLKNSVKLCLTSRFPIVMYWGAERIMLYNDPCITFLGETKHPACLGRAGQEASSDIWDTIDPLFQSVERTGEATWPEDFLFFAARNLPREEVYVTYTIGPILIDDNRVGGFFCPCMEVTEKVLAARRVDTLRKLEIQARETRTASEACEAAANVLAENQFDIPFAAIYLVNEDGTQAVVESLSGLPRNANPLPSAVSVYDSDPEPWPLARVLRERRASDTGDLVVAGMQLPGGRWPEPSQKAIVLPVFGAQHDSLCALAVLGVGPRRVLDDSYRTFLDLVADHIGRAISDACAYEAEQQRASDPLRTSQNRFRRYFELGLIGMAITSPAKASLEANERNQAEEALRKAEAQLAHVSRLTTIGELTASIAHEVNQPLGAIVTNGHACLRLLSGAKPDLASAREAVESMIADGVRASEVIKRIRAMLKKSSTGKSLHHINDIIREVIAFTAVEREKYDISLTTELAPNLPMVLVDRVQLQQVMLNLVLNSIEAMSAPERYPRHLMIVSEQTTNEVVVSIRDTGVGIDPEHRQQVFDPFFTSKEGGLGLGLSISRSIIDAHGGLLWTVPSAAHEGATFYFTLPIHHN